MEIDCLIEVIERARKSWEFVLGLVPDGGMEAVDSSTGWSVKDIIAHVAWHEEQMLELAETKDLVGSPWWELSTDERNQKIYEQYKDRSLDEVHAFAKDAYTRMMNALKTLTDEDTNDAKRFTDMPEDWIPWIMIAGNTYQHYYEHAIGIRRMLRAAKA